MPAAYTPAMTDSRSAFAIALHMHQPLIPAGTDDLATAPAVSNLQYMLEHPGEKDAHNAPVFIECYRRMADLVGQLLAEGARPRVMLDYSGTLLHGLALMGREDVLDAVRRMATEGQFVECVEFLGTGWGHPVAPSTPPADFRLHVERWRAEFAALCGEAALSRVRGFSPPEMALPNHPDVVHSFVRTLTENGYRYVLVQEHTVEAADGSAIRTPHLPHRLVVRNARGEETSIVALVKTQGSDTKLVGQMQPYYEAKNLSPVDLAGHGVPQLVTQVADGENGGVMMNEFPPKFLQVMREASWSQASPMNGWEYLEHLRSLGVTEADFPVCRPLFSSRIDPHLPTDDLPGLLERLRKDDGRFNVEGGSWTNDLSWTRGYESLLNPMQRASARFHAEAARRGLSPASAELREALDHLLLGQTSCFRYWGEGPWTEYGKEFCRRAVAALG